jgi:tetratricopeptide (TPR) repeat protein
MSEYPQRSNTHTIEEESDRFFKRFLPLSWVANKPVDYGLDYYIEIGEGTNITGKNFSVQLKSHEKLAVNNSVEIVLKRSTVNMYLNRLEPLLLICYIRENQDAYYDWFGSNTVDLTKDYQEYTIKINKSHKLSLLNWDDIIRDINKIFSRKFLLNALPEIDFSEIPDGLETIAAGYYVKGEFEKAEQAYKKLLAKEIRITWLSALAMCQYSLYRYREALININRALELSDTMGLWLNKASILAEDGIVSRDKAKVLEASTIFKKAITNSDDSHYCYNYANTLTELGEYALAETYYKKALKKNPNYAEAWKNLGEIYFRTHRHDKERICYENALKINPELPEALMTLGIYEIRGNQDAQQALLKMQKALEIQPDLFARTAMGHYWFALAYRRLNNEPEFLKHLKKGLDFMPGDVYLLHLKQDHLKGRWRNSDADENAFVEFLKYRLNLNPADLVSFVELVEVYLGKNHLKEALKLIRANTGLLRNIDDEYVIDNEFPVAEYVTGLYSYREYAEFRIQHPANRYEPFYRQEHILPFVELISLYIFHEALILCRKNSANKDREHLFCKLVVEQALAHYPACAPLMITATKEEVKTVTKEMAEAMTMIPQIALRESGLILGHLSIKYKLNQGKMDRVLSEEEDFQNLPLPAFLPYKTSITF